MGATESPPPNTIRVIGEAQVRAPANLALLDFGVVTQAETAAAASRQNAQQMEAVLAAARKAAGAAAQISTGAYSIRPVYAAQREAGSPRITGYEVSNILHVRITELARVSETIDAAVRAGANRVQRLAFTLADEDAAKRQALGSAVLKAWEKAQTVAKTLGVTVGPVHSVLEEDVGLVRPLVREAFAAQIQSVPATPIEPGEVEVRARVTLTTEIAR
jgi:uncharacterized protein